MSNEKTQAVGAPPERNVGRLEPKRVFLKKTYHRVHGLLAVAGGQSHPGQQSLCYVLEKAGLTEWDKAGNRYRITALGIQTLAHWKTPND
jgi:hypothetical protein